MSINSLERRLVKLESSTGIQENPVTAIFITSPEIKLEYGAPTPGNSRHVSCHILGGDKLWMKDYSNENSYLIAVSKEHERVYGEPLDTSNCISS